MASLLRTLSSRNASLLSRNVELQFSPSDTPWTQFVRWRRNRKPLWLGPAKHKLYWVPKRPNPPAEERRELARLYPRYKTHLKAMYVLIKENMREQQEKQKQALQFQTKEEEEEEWAECMAINAEWNAESAALREQRLACELEKVKEKARQKKIKRDERRKEITEELNAKVRLEKEKSKTYITAENIDEAIEKALDTLTDFNYAIDLQGNFYHGRKTKPEPQNAKRSADPKADESVAREAAQS